MTIVLNSLGEFTVRCISGVLSESNPGFRKLSVLLFFLFLPTGDGASTLGGLFSFLSFASFHEWYLELGVSSVFYKVVIGGSLLRVGGSSF